MFNLSKTFGLSGSLLLVLLAICFSALPALGQYGGGSGTAEDPYLISTPAQMNAIGANQSDWDKHFKLMADIDLSAYTGTSFNIIGIYIGDIHPDNRPFTGVFDGNDHTISNFTYTSTGTGYIGIFRYIIGRIKDLGLINPIVDAGTGNYVGSLVGRSGIKAFERGGTITGCYVEGGSITGGNWVGGLVGRNDQGTITGCHSTGQVQGQQSSGGLVGMNSGLITDCYSTASVSGTTYVGGLVGRNEMDLGWIIKGIISNCYSTGQVQGESEVGGLVGRGGNITNCYSTASVSGTTYVGGLVGRGGNITNCYSTGSVSGTAEVGGLVGSGATVYDSFWDIQTSGEPNSAGGTGLTTAEMQDMNTFLGAGWDFVGEYENGPHDYWAQGSGGGYMVLWWQLPENELPALTFSGGAGTESDPYLISNATDLNIIGHNGRLMDKNFRLINDINLGGVDLYLIGSNEFPFASVFDGNGHTISNFTYTSSGTDRIGLFRRVNGLNAEIRDLGLIDPNVDAGTGENVGSLAGVLNDARISGCYVESGSVTGGGSKGGLVGTNGGTIYNCYSRGSVPGGGRKGGLVGKNSGTISNCYSTGSFSGGYPGGGLVGENSGTISNCYSTASLAGGDYKGGLVGTNGGTIADCYATGSVSGRWNIGGLAGWNSGTIINCYSTGSVSGSQATSGNEAIGGLVGFQRGGGISNCYFTGNVSGPGKDVGGLVGHNESPISGCYSAGTVSSTSHHIGGLVGLNQTTGSFIINCYSTASVAGNGSVGGLVGRNEGTVHYSYSAGSVSGSGCGGLVGTGGLVFFSFWDIETSGQVTSGGGLGLPTAPMQMESTFTAVLWDFVYFWDICEGTNYPKLAWQVPVLGDFGCPDGVEINDLAVLCEQWLFELIPADVWPDGGDGIVNFLDWAIFAEGWQTTHDIFDLAEFADQWLKTGSNYLIADIAPDADVDGIVNMLDFAALAENWLAGL